MLLLSLFVYLCSHHSKVNVWQLHMTASNNNKYDEHKSEFSLVEYSSDRGADLCVAILAEESNSKCLLSEVSFVDSFSRIQEFKYLRGVELYVVIDYSR